MRRFTALFVVAMVACGQASSETGLGEPIRVRNGVFKDGPIPSSSDPSPTITAIEMPSAVLRPGQGEKGISGRASPTAVAVAVGIGGLGSGYWLIPVDGPDPLNNGELGWQAAAEIARDVPPGRHDLVFSAIDAAGHPGPLRALPVCVPSIVPDNLNVCDATIPPPAAVLSLSWDAQVDLDLVIVAPDGHVVDAKHPQLATVAAFDRDSNAACANDAIRRENLVFQDAPPRGSYLVYANLFDACGRAPVHFSFTLHERRPTGLVQTLSQDGVLTAIDANGGAALGTFVVELPF